MKIQFLDTNILARFLVGDVPKQQTKVVEIFEKGISLQCKYIVLPEVIMELNYVLSVHYGFDKQTIINNLNEVLDIGFITIPEKNSIDFTKVLDFYEQYNISMEDCLYLQYCIENKIDLVTLDQKLFKIWKKVGVDGI